MNRYRFLSVGIVAAALAATALAGCSDSTGPGADLTREQAQKVAQAASRQAYTGDFASSGSASLAAGTNGTAARDFSRATTVELTADRSCPEGGTVRYDVSASQNEAADSVSVTGNLQYESCTTTVDSSTVTLTTPDDTALEFSGTLLRPSESEVNYSSQLSGDLEYTIEGESGTCTIDLETRVTITRIATSGSGSVDASTSGRVCNHGIERALSVQSDTS